MAGGVVRIPEFSPVRAELYCNGRAEGGGSRPAALLCVTVDGAAGQVLELVDLGADHVRSFVDRRPQVPDVPDVKLLACTTAPQCLAFRGNACR